VPVGERQPDDTVAVTIRDVRDVAALQRKLNEDGVRAQVLAADDMPPGCENVPGTNKDINAIVTDLMAPGTTRYFVIHPDAIPADSTLQLDIFPPITPAHHATGRRISNRQSASGFGEQNVPSVAMFLIYTGSHC
jgi:hypothetical protein